MTARSPSNPSVLLVATARWAMAARLAMRFRDLGATVSAVRPSDHPLDFVHGLDRLYPCKTWAPLRSLARAIESSGADFVVPIDDLAVWQLHALAATDAGIASIVARSIGNPESFPVIRSRFRLLTLAASLGIGTPESAPVNSEEEVRRLLADWPLPGVVKKDGTNNGSGVAFASTPEEAIEAYRALSRGPSLLARLKRRMINGEPHAFLNSRLVPAWEISLQSFVQGVPANAMYACDQGKVLAAFQVRSIWNLHAAGTSLVVERMEDPRIMDAGVKLASALQLSGFFGLDFLLQPGAGEPILLEMNPRPTQLGHLPLDPATSGYSTLAGALWSAWTGNPEPPLEAPNLAKRIIFFPNGSVLPPNDPDCDSAMLDVPVDEPDLLRELAGRPWHHRRLIARFYDSLRRPEPFHPVHFDKS